MPHECQAVLLRFLQEGTVERLGGNGPIHVDVRVISATHVDLDKAVEEGRFRADLYHRLCVLRLVEPPLRERGELLANYALSMYKQDGARKLRGLSSDAIVAMSNYAWPGNVRELINCVRRAVVMSEGRFITANDLGLPATDNGPAVKLAEIRSKAEKDAIEHALQRHGYKLSEAAAELGISRATLYRLMHADRLHPEPSGGHGSNGGTDADGDGEAERRAFADVGGFGVVSCSGRPRRPCEPPSS
ncbi:MAG: Nitrogen regulation protein NR(I) [uncultured Paraburkholderia sp.]|nr:MAG: Nitrogen regulation protein NR(I) [uncultured Paraburkholderia sp.]